MYLVLLAAVAIMLLIFNIVSLKSFFQKKTTLPHLLFGFFMLALIVTYLVNLVILATSLVTILDSNRPRIELKSPVYMVCSWFLVATLFIKLLRKKFVFFLYKSVFIEEPELEDTDQDIEARESEERRKTYKRKKVDVKEVPNFVQKFTSTYFKIKHSRKKV